MHSHSGKFLILLCIALSVLAGLAACGIAGGALPTDVFIPPTRMPTLPPTATPIPRATPTIQASPTALCKNELRFLEDLTIPDGTQVQPGATIDKRWRVKNDSTCNWDSKYRIQLVSGPAMGAHEEQALYPARGGSEATIRIVFTAPSESGVYRSDWQAFTPDGEPFGETFYLEFSVP